MPYLTPETFCSKHNFINLRNECIFALSNKPVSIVRSYDKCDFSLRIKNYKLPSPIYPFVTKGQYDKCECLKEAPDSGLEYEVHMGIIYVVFIYSCIYLGFPCSNFSSGTCFLDHIPLCLLYLQLCCSSFQWLLA